MKAIRESIIIDLGDIMSIFKNTIVTKIYPTVTVFSKQGRKELKKDRPCWGLSFCIDGQITYTHNKKEYVSNSKNAILLPKGATYSISGNKDGLFPVINFECENLKADTPIVIPISDSKSYIKEYNALSNCFLFDNKLLKQFQIFYNMLERLDSEQTKTPISSIISFLEDSISDNTITNELLAEKLGVSEVYLRKLFLSNLGSTPKQYILDLRIKKAKQLLKDSNYTVTEIAEKCGFSSLYHFCRIFKTKTACTPLEYAQNNKVFEI